MKILIKTWETRLVTLRSPDLGNWTRAGQAWENFSYAWSVWEEAETQPGAGNILLIYHELLCNASSFNKAVLKLVENRKLLPHFLSRRARHGPNKKTILCPLGMVSRLMSPLIGCLKTVRASHWPRLTTWQLWYPSSSKKKIYFCSTLTFLGLLAGSTGRWGIKYLGFLRSFGISGVRTRYPGTGQWSQDTSVPGHCH